MSVPATDSRPRLGLIVNPIAGMGGKVGLKGTDGEALLVEAVRRGAVPFAASRAERALARLRTSAGGIGVLTAAGERGETVARNAGFSSEIIGSVSHGDARDTVAAAIEMAAAGADLILFAGGDGTARDVLRAIGDKVPVLGIPAGVKMHSAVFATTPENAGAIAEQYLLGGMARTGMVRDAEVMDVESNGSPDTRQARLYGYLRVPHVRLRIQHAKAASSFGGEAELDEVCREIACNLDPDGVHLFGPGTTIHRIMQHAGLEGTLLGVDAVAGGRVIGRDVSEKEILSLIDGKKVHIVVGVVGGQGFLFGRGNQQISAQVLRRAGRDGITIVSPMEKMLALEEHRLLVDTGDAEVDAALSGFMRVRTGPGQSVMCRVAA